MSTPALNTPTPPINVDDALARLRSLGGRITGSRRDIVDFFYRHSGRFSADDLAARFPAYDAATVYRTLNSLEDAGIVEHVHLGHGPATYRRAGANTIPVVCEQCGKVIHVPHDEFADIGSRLRDTYGFAVDLGHFAITGRCEHCSRKPRRPPK